MLSDKWVDFLFLLLQVEADARLGEAVGDYRPVIPPACSVYMGGRVRKAKGRNGQIWEGTEAKEVFLFVVGPEKVFRGTRTACGWTPGVTIDGVAYSHGLTHPNLEQYLVSVERVRELGFDLPVNPMLWRFRPTLPVPLGDGFTA